MSEGPRYVKTYYDELPSEARLEVRIMIKRKSDVYMAGFLIIGFSSLVVLSAFVVEHATAQLLLSVVGLITTGKFWHLFWKNQDVLAWMEEWERRQRNVI